MDLTRRSLDLLEQHKLAEAEDVLTQALRLSPVHFTNLYNMACVQALRGHKEQAIQYLQCAALAGFTDFQHLETDSDLQSLHELPAYRKLIQEKDEYQRRAAQRTVEWLKHELGQGYLFSIDEENKLIFATNTDQQTLDSLREHLLKQAKCLWADLFEHRPDQYISIIIPSAKDYKEIVNRPGVGGFYNHEHRILIAQRLGQVVQHEFTHALHNADLDPLGQEHPVWLSEGLASLYEAAQFVGDKLVPADTYRLRWLQLAARRGRLIPFERLFKMDQKAFTTNSVVNLTYGESASIMLYLYEKHLLRGFYDAYKASYDQDKTGLKALEQVTGMKLIILEKAWRAWMLRRTPPALTTGPEGAILGIRLGVANDGVRVEALLADGPAERAGIEVGDIIVGLDEHEARDTNTLMPLVAAHRPGESVKLKVRRGEEYLHIPLILGRRDEADVKESPPPRFRQPAGVGR
jgi:hypothetical protein